MGSPQNLKGKKFGRLTPLEVVGTSKIGRIWLCVCDCGNEKRVATPDLNCGKIVSCGCRRKEILESGFNRGNLKPGAVWRTKEYYRDWKREKRKNDPVYVMQHRLSANLRSAFATNRIKKNGKTFDLLGYSVTDLCDHIEKCFIKGMNWDNRDQWHIDHIVPISSAKNEEDLISLNQLSNLRPIWSKDNIKKADKRTHLL